MTRLRGRSVTPRLIASSAVISASPSLRVPAKQSSHAAARRLDCFAALAMTAEFQTCIRAPWRRLPESFQTSSPFLTQRARGMPGAQRTRSKQRSAIQSTFIARLRTRALSRPSSSRHNSLRASQKIKCTVIVVQPMQPLICCFQAGCFLESLTCLFSGGTRDGSASVRFATFPFFQFFRSGEQLLLVFRQQIV